jgi:hypothetical protein
MVGIMIINIQTLCVDDIQNSDSEFVLDCKKYLNLSAIEIKRKGNNSKDRSPLWRIMQSKVVGVVHDTSYYLLGAMSLSDKSVVQRWKIDKNFWSFAIGNEFCDNFVLGNQWYISGKRKEKFVYAWAELSPVLSFEKLDYLLSRDKYFFLSISKQDEFRVNEVCLQGWSHCRRNQQIPNEISELISYHGGIAFLSLGRFDDPDFSVICISGGEIFQRLKKRFF